MDYNTTLRLYNHQIGYGEFAGKVKHVTTHDQDVVKGGQKLELIIKSTSTYQMIGIFILHSALPKLRTANDHRGNQEWSKMTIFKKHIDLYINCFDLIIAPSNGGVEVI